ncbi:MAG: hypothetical protein J1G01_01595 [Clostridiales bacterium]|nr:hypothetical protein [Clostridiales bacterium]
MLKIENDKQLDEKLLKGLCCMQANILMNSYAAENVVFNKIQPTAPLPFDSYIEDLELQLTARFFNINQMDGTLIDNGHIKDLTYDEVCFELYRDKIDLIFHEAPTYEDTYTDYDNDIYHYKHGLYEYLKELYTLFCEIIAIDVTPSFFDTLPEITDKAEQRLYYNKIIRFVSAIKLKHLRQGSCVDRYVKGLRYISPFVRRLLKEHKGRYILINNDTDSLDYKFALFSCFRFYNEHNAKLLELKMLRWKELNI